MLPRDFTPTFNEAVKSQDWKLVIILGEQAIAEKSASNDILYNLGLAYLKTGKPAMATAVLLGVPKVSRDDKTGAALNQSLRFSNTSTDDLILGAHGLNGGLVTLADIIPTGTMQVMSTSGLALLIVLFVVYISSYYKKVQRLFNLLFFVTAMAVSVSGVSLLIQFFYKAHWGAVVAETEATVFSKPQQGAQVAGALKTGNPILVLGQSKGPWLRVWGADGIDGWVQSLDVRVIAD
jgi:hypothetical protein